ncbi:hypothetical protein GCM10007939_01150 [Amylibacter marinus]|uniref:HTH marR-type domain-containing protein n=1 Tax=Amylibacter marinus TaxID=1475483 RepID=A0ABQ5VRF3_9RHOB|nr:MarR family winged helix-turn-helix transcriptional regulator [Amylibacter marinus]GLQ33832.1 hypothetical protein GCM10007939_01150 [Amylibacter marinus]
MAKLTGPLVGKGATWLAIVTQLYTNRMAVLLKPHGLTLGQFSILHHITRQKLDGGNRISDIANAVEFGQPSVTKAVAKFQNMGLVEISESMQDKRSKTVQALPAASDLLDEIHAAIGPDLFQAFSAIDDDQIEGFISQLQNLGEWLDRNRQT